MFDIGFSELLMVGLVALLVIGPERLPTAARTAGILFGRLKRGINNIREEVERELGADQIRLDLRNEEILAKERKMLAESAKHISNAGDEINTLARETADAINKPVAPEHTEETPVLPSENTESADSPTEHK